MVRHRHLQNGEKLNHPECMLPAEAEQDNTTSSSKKKKVPFLLYILCYLLWIFVLFLGGFCLFVCYCKVTDPEGGVGLGDSNFLLSCACLCTTVKVLWILIWRILILFSKCVNLQIWNLCIFMCCYLFTSYKVSFMFMLKDFIEWGTMLLN